MVFGVAFYITEGIFARILTLLHWCSVFLHIPKVGCFIKLLGQKH